jgi:hypothetical protein
MSRMFFDVVDSACPKHPCSEALRNAAALARGAASDTWKVEGARAIGKQRFSASLVSATGMRAQLDCALERDCDLRMADGSTLVFSVTHESGEMHWGIPGGSLLVDAPGSATVRGSAIRVASP